MHPRSSALLSLLGAVALVSSSLMSACGGDDGTNNTGSISLSVSPTSGTVQAGGSLQVTGTITRSGGFTGNVSFAVTGASLPAGLSGSAGNIVTSGDVTTATITLTTTSATPAGTYALTVTGSGSGVTSSSVTFNLTVTAAPVGSYTLAVNPATVSVVQGTNSSTTVSITRTNFTGAVTLAVEGLPSGVTASFNPASPVTANSTQLTLTATGTATTGVSTVTIRGTTPGQSPENTASVIADQSVTLQLTVTAASGGGNYTLSATSATLSFAQGGGGTSTININRTGGFAGSVALAVTGQPANMTASMSPTPTTANSSTLTITTTAAVAAGNYTLTITGTFAGLTNQTTTVAVTVTSAGNYTLSATAATLSFAQGAGGTSTININRTGGFAGSVALAVTGQPANLTAILNPTSTTTNSSTLTITTTGAVAVGSYTLTITGTATGLTNQTTTVGVTVTGSGGSGNVTVDFSACPVTGRPLWFAGLNGSTWTQVTGTNNVYSFSVNQSKGGYAYVTQNGSNFTTAVAYLTQAELTSGTFNICGTGTPVVGKTITGTVTGFGAGLFTSVNIGLGGAFANATSGVPGFTLQNVADGPNDLVMWRSDLIAGPSASDRGLIERGLNPADGTSIGTKDMTGGTSFAPATATATITGLVGGENINGGMSYATGAACRIASLYSFLTGSASQAMFGVPAAQQLGTDFHSFSVFTTSGTPPTFSGRTHTEVFHTLANRTIALAPNFTGTVTIITAPYKVLQIAGTIPAAYQTAAASFTYYTGDGTRAVTVTASPGWIGGANLVMGFADLTAQGYLATWGPAGTLTYNAAVSGFTNLTSTFCAEGATVRTAFFAGQM